VRTGALRRRTSVATLVLVAGAILSACGSSSATSKGSITLYSGQHVQTTDSLIAGFEKQTGITVNLRSNDEDTLADQMVTEGNHSPADVPCSSFFLAEVSWPRCPHRPSHEQPPSSIHPTVIGLAYRHESAS